ncbi:hypothetical protein K6W36_07955 [Acetobacter senegalensis]|uniref:hypothetical protein n=1 Tax=Acetobacter senegalensis TaxID=446692 RepID=UPI001EDC912D|nr:hypothetical protein [Acetobacter senegalensis]MCG4260517.1 hypothetical protein [Acetobacter senegalensis]
MKHLVGLARVLLRLNAEIFVSAGPRHPCGKTSVSKVERWQTVFTAEKQVLPSRCSEIKARRHRIQAQKTPVIEDVAMFETAI